MTVQPIGVLMFCNNLAKAKLHNYTETHSPEYETFCHLACATIAHVSDITSKKLHQFLSVVFSLCADRPTHKRENDA